MSKKILLWVSLTVFVFFEILFSPITSLIAFFSGIENFHYFYEYFIDSQFFIDNQIFLLLALIIESFSVLGLLFWNIKYNNKKFKSFFLFLCLIIFLLLMFLLYIGIYTYNGIGF